MSHHLPPPRVCISRKQSWNLNPGIPAWHVGIPRCVLTTLWLMRVFTTMPNTHFLTHFLICSRMPSLPTPALFLNGSNWRHQ